MKRKNQKIQIIMLIVISVFAIYGISDLYVDYSLTANKEYMENATAITQLPGTYTSTDGKTITVASDGTTKYLDTYTLTITEAATGNVLSGKVGTNNKTATLYQLNDKSLVSSTSMNYTTAEGTIYLYDHTVFTTTKTVSPDQTGAFELWRENSKVNTYKTLQDAVDSASSGDTIKITKDLVVTEGTYINKNITIEGNNHTLDKSKWYNPAIVVEEGAILNINNLTIDGGAKNFEVDFSLAYPKIKTGTLELDPKANISSIISKGTLNADKVNMNNHYTTGNGSAMKIIRGNGKITNCNFNHNYAGPEGAAIYIGSQPRVGETTFPAKNIYIDNCDFTYNYSVLSGSVAGGAAIAVNWTEKIDVKNSEFIRNMTGGWSSGGGPAIFTNRKTVAFADANELEYTQLTIDNCLFESNYVANDGAAIENENADMTIRNSSFISNVGLGGGQSVGTVSCSTDGRKLFEIVMENVIFEKNNAAASIFGDHGTPINLTVKNLKAQNNVGSVGFLLYSSHLNMENAVFKDERVKVANIDVRPITSITQYPLYNPQEINLKDVNFENTDGPTDIILRRKNHNMNYNHATLNINGNVEGNVKVWDANFVNVNAPLTGNIELDETTQKSNVIVKSPDLLKGKIIENPNTYIITINFPNVDTNNNSVDIIYLEKDKTYTEKEIFMHLQKQKEGYTMKLYTDANYTTPWDYKSTNSMTLYGRWEEHTHEFDGTLILENNKIYEQCILGHFGKELSLSSPTENTYNGKEIPITVNNGLNAKDYKVVYYTKDNNDWKEINTIPIEAGNYKAVLTYNNLEISQEYSILEPPKVEEPEKEEPKEEDKKEEESKEEDKTEENIPPLLEEEKEETPKEEPKDENNPFTSNNASKIFALSAALISSISLFVMYIIQNKKIQKNI